MMKNNREQYDDNKFYMDAVDRWFYYNDDWDQEDFQIMRKGEEYIFCGLPNTLAGIFAYSYDNYEDQFQKSHENVNFIHLNCQTTKLNENEFKDIKERILHFTSTANTIRQKIEEKVFLLSVLFLNPYQHYYYKNYLKAYKKTERPNAKGLIARLEQTEFEEQKKNLLFYLREKEIFVPIKADIPDILSFLLLDRKGHEGIKTIYDL